MTPAIPAEHSAAACPACSAGFPCRVVTRGHLAYWSHYRARPAAWGPVLLRDARADAGQPPPAPPPSPASPAVAGPLQVAEAEGCPHYRQGWCCGSYHLTCLLGRGQAGVLDGHECRGCDRGA